MSGSATAAPRRAAREAQANPALRVLARAGYAANGLVHILIGVIVLVIATGGSGESDQSGAFKAVAEAPAGFVALWALALALVALGVWHAFDGILVTTYREDAEGEARKWGRRLSEWGQAVVFIALGVLSASVALGARPDSEKTTEGASRTVLSMPGGPFLLSLVGLGVGIGGIAFVVMGVRRSFRNRMDIPSGPLGTAVTALGVVGFVAKGIALGIVGALLLFAVFASDPKAAGGLDGAIAAALQLPGGPWIAGFIGAGFAAYGVFCLFRARYARLRAG
jgi:hypothetical protein